MNYKFLLSLIVVYLLLVLHMYLSFDLTHLPKEFVNKHRIKQNSFLRKIVPIFESEKKEVVCLNFRVIPVLLSEIILLIGLVLFFIDLKYCFIPYIVYKIFSIFYIIISYAYCVFCSLIKYIINPNL